MLVVEQPTFMKLENFSPKEGCLGLLLMSKSSYFALVYLVTAFVPSDTACLANSPGNKRRTAV
jgi:hypothetical protein